MPSLPSPVLVLRADQQVVLLGDRPVAIGRLPECEVALDGLEVSRRHARIVPTPGGPLLVDRSRHGTLVNGSQVVAPTLLRPGDRIAIGGYLLSVEMVDSGPAAPETGSWLAGLGEWRRRYGPSELVGTVAAVVAAVATVRAGGGVILAAFAGTFAEAAWFYAVLGWRDLRRAARLQGKSAASLRLVGRNLLREFGLAEALDSLLLRPLSLGLGLRLLGGWPGALAGKLVADLLFYGPVLGLCHWRLGQRPPPPDDNDRRRATSARLPLLPR